jgi:hypothetical protein
MAQGPTGHLTLGVNSSTGGYVGGSIGVSSDYLRGADPMLVYERCVVDLTWTGPDPTAGPALMKRMTGMKRIIALGTYRCRSGSMHH